MTIPLHPQIRESSGCHVRLHFSEGQPSNVKSGLGPYPFHIHILETNVAGMRLGNAEMEYCSV
jgi:hypothetical protein